MRAIVIGTAGHIDHGKSALVLALTGTDPDRLQEEKARGITIDLGFVSGTFRDGRCNLGTFSSGTVTCLENSGGADPLPDVTWRVAGGKLFLDLVGDETAEVFIGAGGRVLIAGGTSTRTSNQGWSNIVVAIRLPNP